MRFLAKLLSPRRTIHPRPHDAQTSARAPSPAGAEWRLFSPLPTRVRNDVRRQKPDGRAALAPAPLRVAAALRTQAWDRSNPARDAHSGHRLAPENAPPRPKSFLEKTLTRANPLRSTTQTTHPATPPPATASPAKLLFAKVLAFLLLAALLTACGDTPTQELHVFAAASLREAITEAADDYQHANPDIQVVTNVAGSQVLRLQIESGARADLFVSANPDHLDALENSGLLHAPPTIVAANVLVLAVPAGNPAGLNTLDDLTQPGRRIVMAAESVPAGAYARQMLARHAAASGRPAFADAVLQRVISFETNVRQVAAKLELGEADAGFVYRTDIVASDGRLQVIETPTQVQVTARYPAAVLRDAADPQLADRFLTFLRSPEAQAILARHGFGPAA